MGLLDALKRLFGGGPGPGLGLDELARRLGMGQEQLQAFQPSYREFTIPKRSGGRRKIAAPDDELKALQRRILRRLLRALACHAAAFGFQRGRSIVTNALRHTQRAVVLHMDLRDFFDSTRARRVREYFRAIGWNKEVAKLLERLCTHDGGLPQGAPTSPRLSNLVNYRLDARLAAVAKTSRAVYTRYADDMTFSFAADQSGDIRSVIRSAKRVAAESGYTLHQKKKLHIRRDYDRQLVTGLVVNERVNLPRDVRRWLRAVEHHHATGRPASLTLQQLAGWKALQAMIETQRSAAV